MKRFGLLALVAAVSAAGGCASSAKYVEKKPDSGVVAVPDDSDSWPNHNRRAALQKIEEHVGPDYEIVDQRTVKTGRAMRTGLPSTNETLNPRNPGAPAYHNASTHATELPEETQFQITYRRKSGPAVGDIGQSGTQGLVPAGGTVRTQYMPGGAPAGGMVSPFNRPTVAPAGGAACDS